MAVGIAGAPPRGSQTPAALAELRARLAAMGGLADLSRPAPPRPRPAPPSTAAERASALGFVAEGEVLVRRALIDLGPFLERAGVAGPAAPEDLVRLLLRLQSESPVGPFADGDTAVLDIETLGLRGSGVVPFLVGIGVPSGRALELDQWLLADLEGEAAMLDAVSARLAGRRVLVTYNGRAFDLPVLQARCILNRRPPEAMAPPIHCDLLAPVRRLFRDRLGSCTLRQAELSLLGLEREGDVPGAEAPARFRAWLMGSPTRVLEGVIRHNQLDVCATSVLGSRLAAHVAGSLVRPVHPSDRFRLGVHLEAVGLADEAEEHLVAAFRDADSPWSRPAGHRLAGRLRRRARDFRDGPRAPAAGGDGGPIAVLTELLRRNPDDLLAARGLVIALERGGDLEGALRICADAERALAARALWRRRLCATAPGAGPAELEWSRRKARLDRRRRRAATARTAQAKP